MVPKRRVFVGIALLCFANLLLEIVLTRVFSATMYYHFTFLAIALALFGMGAAGVYVYLRADRFRADTVERDLATASRRFAAATILAVAYVLANPINLGVGASRAFKFTGQTLIQLVLLNAVTALPFFFAGIVVSLAITHYRRCIGTVYSYDLAGAALAALVCSALLGVFGGPTLILLVAALAAASAVVFDPPRRLRDGWPVAATTALLIVNLIVPVFAVPSVKGVKSDRTLFEKWNAFSRVTVEKLKNGELDIKIDASAATRIADGRKVATRRWQTEITALAYTLHPGGAEHALIIGPGGGPDVANALASGARSVTGVEINPIIAEDIMRDRFADASGRLYFDDRVDLVTDEGRSFIRRSESRYDVIQATLVDTWAATAAGAFALTENTLYTVEAFEDYYAHLTDGGVLTMSRWFGGRDPETERLLVLACAGLVAGDVAPTDCRKHMVVAKNGNMATLLAKRTPFTEAELARLEQAARVAKHEIILSPTTGGDSRLERLVDAGPYSPLVARQHNDLSPPTDDRPFFFYFVKGRDLFRMGRHGSTLTNPAFWILIAFGVAITALTIGFILVPLLAHRTADLRAGSRADLARRVVALGYFAAIGLAFMVIEIALMQKLGLFLGHPSYGLIVVLFSVLIATSLGARASERVADGYRARIVLAASVVLAALAVGYALVLGGLLRDWVAWSLPARVVTSVILAGAAGVVMGMMLPIGVRLVGDRDDAIIPWAWGINGAMSVIGTVIATILAIHFGFATTMMIGAGIYVAAGVLGNTLGRAVART